jgi:hypothetical protein
MVARAPCRCGGGLRTATAGSRPQDPPAGGRSLSKALSDGMRKGTPSQNPASRATAPKQRRREFKTWNAAELRASWRHQRVTTCIPCGSSWLRVGCAVSNCWAFAGTTRTGSRSTLFPTTGRACGSQAGRSLRHEARKQAAGSSSSIGPRSKSSHLGSLRSRSAWPPGEVGRHRLVFTQLTGAGIHPERVSRRFAF